MSRSQKMKVVQKVASRNDVPASSKPGSISQASETGIVKASSLSERRHKPKLIEYV